MTASRESASGGRERPAVRVLIAAGGTGGHVFPALAVAERLRERGVGLSWLGTASGLEAERVPAAGIEFHVLAVRGLRGKGWRGLLGAPAVVLRAVLGSLRVLRAVRPHVVLGMGGYASGPAGLVAWARRIPLVIHEQNAIPGLTNRLLAPLADIVLEAFPGSFPPQRGAIHTGNPLRAAFDRCADEVGPERGRREEFRVLVLGGSQGALRLNELLPAAFAAVAQVERLRVWHQAGRDHLDAARAGYAEAGLEVCAQSFIDDMVQAYDWADLVVCRAGAMTVAELARSGNAAILVPFPFAVDDHQTANARFLVDAGAAVLLDQRELGTGRLTRILDELMAAPEKLREMARAARRVAVPDAAERVARHCLEAAHV